MKRAVFAALLLGLLGAIATVPASADSVLYDNTTHLSYSIDAYPVANGNSVLDSFTLSQASVVDGATFGIWTIPGDTVTALDWEITNSGGTVLASGAATNLTGSFEKELGGYDIYQDSTSIASLSLGAGTYFFGLSGGTETDSAGDTGTNVYWDNSDGPSTATYDGSTSIPSETFQILGSTAVTPEPSSILLLATGLAGLGALLRRRLA